MLTLGCPAQSVGGHQLLAVIVISRTHKAQERQSTLQRERERRGFPQAACEESTVNTAELLQTAIQTSAGAGTSPGNNTPASALLSSKGER